MNIYIKNHEKCNLNCLHCYNQKHFEELDVNKTLDFLKKLGQDNYLIFHGGEPLLNSTYFIEEIQKEFQCKTRITSNLCSRYLTDNDIDVLRKMDQIRTSFDIKIRFNNIRNLLVWKNNVQRLTKKEKLNVIVNICLTKYILNKKPVQILMFLQKLGIKNLYLERITKAGNAKDNNDIIPSYDEIDNWLCKLYEENKNFPDIECNEFFMIKSGIRKDFQFCYGRECCCNTITINSDGSVGNCPNDARINTFGTIDDDPKEIIRKIAAKKRSIHQECYICDLYNICRGHCQQIEWQNNMCPYPKKLVKLIMRDMDIKENSYE